MSRSVDPYANTTGIDVIVLLSGGLDSAVALYLTIDKYGERNVDTVTFDYGQAHRVEIESAHWISDVAGVSNRVIPISSLDTTRMVVPGRNIIFLTYAATLSDHLIIGVSKSDYYDFPDCRCATLRALQETLTLALNQPISIETPLIYLTKKEVVLLAAELGVPIGLTHTCYRGAPPCKKCPACVLRVRGFREAGIDDIHS